jgi:DNA-directed RNA polymerase sigma subunit (sigma70/sigma32)
MMTTFTTEDRVNAGRGAGDDAEMSYADIAKDMGVSKTRVQQIETSALEKIRKKLIWDHDVFKLKDIL